MFTGYYIKNGHIYGLNGYTKFRIADGHIYEDDKGYTKCWIHNKAIFKVGEGKTRFLSMQINYMDQTNSYPGCH
jgi:hypothetical protein